MSEIVLYVVKSSNGARNIIAFVCLFRCWDDDENGVVLWIIKGPILLTVLVCFCIFFFSTFWNLTATLVFLSHEVEKSNAICHTWLFLNVKELEIIVLVAFFFLTKNPKSQLISHIFWSHPRALQNHFDTSIPHTMFLPASLCSFSEGCPYWHRYLIDNRKLI